MTCRSKACAFSTTDGLSAPGCNHTIEMPSSLHSSSAANPAASGTTKSTTAGATGSAERVFKAKDKQYKYKNETLIELLEISEYEQTHMQIIIGKEEYKRRENIRVKKVYQEKLKSKGNMTF